MGSVMTSAASPEQCDLSVLLRQLDGDRDVARELARIFVLRFPDSLKQLDEALAAEEPELLRRVAHQIKGICALFAAGACVAQAQRIEILATEGNLASALVEGRELRQSLDLMRAEIDGFARSEG